MAVAIYYLGIACLLTHELDAITHSEWRLLFGFRGMTDTQAEPIFVSLHVPLVFIVLWLSHYPREGIRNATRVIVAGFLVVHAALHFGFSSHPLSEFDGMLSQTLIVSAAACGAAYPFARRRWPDR